MLTVIRTRRPPLLWTNIRSLGNSSASKLSIAVPLVGYFILFNRDIIESLQLHTIFCASNCTVSWRLLLLYFGGCAFGAAALIYAWYCPQIVKRYDSAPAYFNAEVGFYANQRNVHELLSSLEAGRLSRSRDLSEVDQSEYSNRLPAFLGQHYASCNEINLRARQICILFYSLGFALIGIPTVITFGQVLVVATRRVSALLT